MGGRVNAGQMNRVEKGLIEVGAKNRYEGTHHGTSQS